MALYYVFDTEEEAIERNGVLVRDYVTQDLSDAVVEEYQADWFPQPASLP